MLGRQERVQVLRARWRLLIAGIEVRIERLPERAHQERLLRSTIARAHRQPATVVTHRALRHPEGSGDLMVANAPKTRQRLERHELLPIEDSHAPPLRGASSPANGRNRKGSRRHGSTRRRRATGAADGGRACSGGRHDGPSAPSRVGAGARSVGGQEREMGPRARPMPGVRRPSLVLYVYCTCRRWPCDAS